MGRSSFRAISVIKFCNGCLKTGINNQRKFKIFSTKPMHLLNAIDGLFYFYVLLFAAMLFVLFAGIRIMYNAIQTKDEAMMRRAKFMLMFTVIAMLCIAVVSFFVTGKLPVD